MLHDRYSEALQSGLVADTRLHEDLRRVNSTERQHYFKPRANAMNAAPVGNLQAGGSLTLEGQSRDQCVSEHSQIRPVHVWKDVRSEHR
jgi:hypothetical protein